MSLPTWGEVGPYLSPAWVLLGSSDTSIIGRLKVKVTKAPSQLHVALQFLVRGRHPHKLSRSGCIRLEHERETVVPSF